MKNNFLLHICAALMVIGFGIPDNSASADLVINEVRIDQTGTDTEEYFELYADGMSFADLSNYWYVVIGDTSGPPSDQFGVVENVTNLAGFSLNAGDWLLVGEASMTLATPDFVTTLAFENSDNVTHLLVTGFTGAIGDDLDTDNDGLLNSTPWTTVVDGFALLEEVGAGDGTYAGQLGLVEVGPNGSFVPSQAFRDVDGAGGNWVIGNHGNFDLDTPGVSNVAIPEPASATLLGLGVIGLFVRRRR